MNTCKTILAHYVNGNYQVCLFDDGTKVRFTNDNHFCAIFPESIDVKITNFCDANCPMCHEDSSTSGEHGNLSHPFFDSLTAGTELALGGGNPLDHPQLVDFLQRIKAQGVVCNLTVNQRHFAQQRQLLDRLCCEKLVSGVGISMLNDTNLASVINFANAYPHCVIHLIAGVASSNLWQKLANNGLKVLILGYKDFGRGKHYYNKNVQHSLEWLQANVLDVAKGFASISFDNLAIEQLQIKQQLDSNFYNQHYMGDDGDFTMYVDLVKEQFAISSTTHSRHPLTNNIVDMFSVVKQQKCSSI